MNTSLLTLIAYIVVLTPLMLLGFYFARRKMFDPHHKLVMTSVVILNWVLIGAVMAQSYAGGVAPNLPDDIGQINNLLPTIHLITGGIAQILATYLIILMWTENTPVAWLAIIRTRNIKPLMRLTLTLWLITVILGFGIYAVWYGPSSTGGGDADQPAVTEEATSDVDADVDATEEPEMDETEEADDDEEPEMDETEEADDDDDEPEMDETEEVED